MICNESLWSLVACNCRVAYPKSAQLLRTERAVEALFQDMQTQASLHEAKTLQLHQQVMLAKGVAAYHDPKAVQVSPECPPAHN